MALLCSGGQMFTISGTLTSPSSLTVMEARSWRELEIYLNKPWMAALLSLQRVSSFQVYISNSNTLHICVLPKTVALDVLMLIVILCFAFQPFTCCMLNWKRSLDWHDMPWLSMKEQRRQWRPRRDITCSISTSSEQLKYMGSHTPEQFTRRQSRYILL